MWPKDDVTSTCQISLQCENFRRAICFENLVKTAFAECRVLENPENYQTCSFLSKFISVGGIIICNPWQNILRLGIVSFHRKWNGTKLLPKKKLNVKVTSGVAEQCKLKN